MRTVTPQRPTRQGRQSTGTATFRQNLHHDCTFFTKKEILRIFKRFQELAPDVIPYNMTGNESSRLKVPLNIIENMPELKENPFRHRICRVFSEDGSGNLSFNDFLNMFSVFCEPAPRDMKTVYAFKIYDFDSDNSLGKNDLRQTLRSLTKNKLTEEEIAFVVDKILEEGDLDQNGGLSFIEFEHVISRDPDFLNICYQKDQGFKLSADGIYDHKIKEYFNLS